jgi:hypothetical protein
MLRPLFHLYIRGLFDINKIRLLFVAGSVTRLLVSGLLFRGGTLARQGWLGKRAAWEDRLTNRFRRCGAATTLLLGSRASREESLDMALMWLQLVQPVHDPKNVEPPHITMLQSSAQGSLGARSGLTS